jgi:hypothetical protein
MLTASDRTDANMMKLTDDRLRILIKAFERYPRFSANFSTKPRYCPDCNEVRGSSRCTMCGLGTYDLDDLYEIARGRKLRLIRHNSLMYAVAHMSPFGRHEEDWRR